MRQNRSLYTRAGSAFYVEWHILWHIWVYKLSSQQEWTPALTELRIERGIRIGSHRLGLSSICCVWHDGRDPAVEPGGFSYARD